MRFLNKVVLVTGGSSGIGAATARLFAREGAKVVIVARNQENLDKINKECAVIGKEPLAIKADLTKEVDAERVISETVDKCLKIDVLVNNVGMGNASSILHENVMKAFDDSITTNVRSIVHLTHLAAPHLINTKGNVINISSIAGVINTPKYLTYSISKACLDHFSRGAALDFARHGVRVNAVSPGPVRTDLKKHAGLKDSWDKEISLSALKRICKPEEIADLIAFLASDAAIGITGSNYVIDNGFSCK